MLHYLLITNVIRLFFLKPFIHVLLALFFSLLLMTAVKLIVSIIVLISLNFVFFVTLGKLTYLDTPYYGCSIFRAELNFSKPCLFGFKSSIASGNLWKLILKWQRLWQGDYFNFHRRFLSFFILLTVKPTRFSILIYKTQFTETKPKTGSWNNLSYWLASK